MEDTYGPLDPSVLYEQTDHRSKNVLDGKYGGIDGTLTCRHGRPGFYAHRDSRLRLEIHPRVVMYLHEMGFYGVYRAAEMDIDRHLITALVERWRPETHTFHLPVGEATVTLEDVAILWGLPIRGRAVSGSDSQPINWTEACTRLLGFTPSSLKGCAVKITDIRKFMKDNPIDDESSDQEVLVWTRCAIFLLMGCVMWPDSNGNIVPLIYLLNLGYTPPPPDGAEFVEDVRGVIAEVASYSWGSALLAQLYRELCFAARRASHNIGGALQPLSECVPVFVESRYGNEMGNYMSMLSQVDLPTVAEVTQGFSTMGFTDHGDPIGATHQINLNVPYQPIVDGHEQHNDNLGQHINVFRSPQAPSTSYINQDNSTNEDELGARQASRETLSNLADPFANSCRDQDLENSEGEMHDDEEANPPLEEDDGMAEGEEDDLIREMHNGLSQPTSPHITDATNIRMSQPGTSGSMRSVSPYLSSTLPEVPPDSIDVPTNHGSLLYDQNIGLLTIGMIFNNKAHVIAAVKDHCIRWSKREYSVIESRPKTWNIACKDRNCPWKLRASSRRSKECWKITKLSPTHYCLPIQQTNDHANLSSAFVASLILPFVRTDYGYEVSNVQTQVHTTYGINISYSKAWQGLNKARAIEFGTWDTSVQKLPRFMEAIKRWNPGTVVEWMHSTSFRSTFPNTYMVKHVFWSFKPCISAFPHMRPVISVDGTHLYTKYRHKLLIAVGIDGNQNILPLAYALVDDETETAWRFFLYHLAKNFCVPSRRICLISDRHRAIISAVASTPEFKEPLGCHRYCLRHICSNFYKAHHDQKLKDLCWHAGEAMDKSTYNRIMRQLALQDADAIKWFDNLEPEMWTVSHDEGMRCGMTTTNLSECFNGVLKNVRRLPIVPIVEATLNRTAHYFVDRQKSGLHSKTLTHHWTDYAWTVLETNLQNCGHHTVQLFDHRDYRAEVITHNPASGGRSRKQVVCLNDKTCTCGFWQRHGIPCSHVMKTARSFEISLSEFVAWYYEVDHYLATYEGGFFPIWDEEYWPEASFNLMNTTEERPRRSGSRRGRERTTRFPMEMDRSQTRERARAAARRGRH